MVKKTVHIIFSGLVFLMMESCQKSIYIQVQKQYPPLQEQAGFVFFEKEDTTDLTGEEIIGEIEINKGMAAGCAYESVVAFAKTKAKSMGANALKIYETRPPDIWIDPCHKIKAKAYRLKNVSQYEKEISWHKGRKLEIRDFKGSTKERPFLAATSTQLRLNWIKNPLNNFATCSVEAWFSCHNSYFKLNADSVETLVHEQFHFDIAELHARILVKRIADEINDINELQLKAQKLLNEISSDLQLMQDKYDSEVYPDPAKQVVWNKKIKDALEEWNAQEIKQVKIKIKA